MNRLAYLITLIATLHLSGIAWGHGFVLKLANGKIVVDHSEVPVKDPNNLSIDSGFIHGMTLSGPNTLTTNHGSIATRDVAGSPVFTSGFTTHNPRLATDDTFHFDFLTPMLFYDGSTTVPAPAGESLHIQPRSPYPFGAPPAVGADITGTSYTAGFNLQGWTAHETDKYLSNWDHVEGAYTYAVRISGHTAGGHDYISSDPLILVWLTPGLANSSGDATAQGLTYGYTAYNATLQALPEPSTFVMFGTGIVCAGVAWIRKRRIG